MSSLLIERVDNATNAEDLLPIFKALPIDTLRDVANNAIGRIAPNERKSMQLKLCSIHKIISHDAMQQILSFIPYCGAVQCVDKTLKYLSGQNAEMRLNQTKKMVNNENFETDFANNVELIFDFNGNNNDMPDSPKQFLLTKRDILLQYVDNKEVYHSFDDILKNEYNKIIIFVEDGVYTLSDYGGNYFDEIAIIGISENVCINLLTSSCDRDFRFLCKNMYIQNITIVPSENDVYVLLGEKSNLWMENCVIKHWFSIEDGNFYAKKCRFITKCTHNSNGATFIRSDTDSSHNFSVLGCSFNATDNISSFIEIEPNHEKCRKYILQNAGHIRIIGNVFKGKCLESAISAMHPGRNDCLYYKWTDTDVKDWNEHRIKIYFSNHKTIQHNIIIGYGTSHKNPNKVKPKKIKYVLGLSDNAENLKKLLGRTSFFNSVC